MKEPGRLLLEPGETARRLKLSAIPRDDPNRIPPGHGHC